MKKIPIPFGVWAAAACWVFAGCLWLFPAYRFSVYLLICLGALFLCFPALRLLGRRFPKAAKVLKSMLLIFVCIGLLAAIITGAFIGKAAKGHPETPCQYLIVLGAGVNGTVPSLSLRDRLLAAKDYLDRNPGTLCVVSGGQGRGELISEAECMKTWLVEAGIAESRILLEDKATNTRENIAYSLELLEQLSGERPTAAAIVSSEYHLFRANFFAKEQNLTMIGIPAKTHRASLMINYYLREIVAVWFYYIFGG